MKKPELYQKTVDILVDAYFNDTLQHGNQCGCAVGNIVAANCGINLCKKDDNIMPDYFTSSDDINIVKDLTNNGLWYDAIFGGSVFTDGLTLNILKQVESTGYTYLELAKIERAFEGSKQGNSDDEWMFNGLMSVIDVLDEIHENNDAAATDAAKKRFQKNFS